MNLAQPESLQVHRMPGRNCRAWALLGGRGAGKTTTLAAFFDESEGMRVLAVDPAGELGRLVGQRADVDVLTVPREWQARPGLMQAIVKRVRAPKSKICIVIPPTAYATAGEFVEELMQALMEAHISDLLLLFEECQRYLGQNREGLSAAALATIEMGRNWRWGCVMATQRPAEVHKGALGRCDSVFISNLRRPRDIEAADDLLELNVPDKAERTQILRAQANFKPGHFLLMEPENIPTVNQ